MIPNLVFSYLAEQWADRTAISWSSMNAQFDAKKRRTKAKYTDPQTHLYPRVELIESEVPEYPATDSIKVSYYQLYLNLLTPPNTGMGHVQEHAERLREIFELKSLVLGEANLDFELLNVRGGFLTQDNTFFDTPSSVLFTAVTRGQYADDIEDPTVT